MGNQENPRSYLVHIVFAGLVGKMLNQVFLPCDQQGFRLHRRAKYFFANRKISFCISYYHHAINPKHRNYIISSSDASENVPDYARCLFYTGKIISRVLQRKT